MKPTFVLCWLVIVSGFLAACPTTQALAQVQDLSYTISPGTEYVLWSGNAGLEDGLLYGGRLGFGFGRIMEVSGVYMSSTNFRTTTSSFSGLSSELLAELDALPKRDVTVQRYGGDLKFNLWNGSVVPFVKAGAGIMAFNPEGLSSSRRIYLNSGLGVQVGTPYRFKLTLQAQNLAYRYNAGSSFFSDEDLATVGLENANFNQITISNWAFGAGFQLYLGGRRPGELSDIDVALQDQLRGGFQGISFPIEPFVARVDFSGALGYVGGQRVGGFYTGLDLGPYVGLRGFYWRGLSDGTLADFEPIQSYGAEVRMRLNAERQSLQPFFALGGGYLDLLGDYEPREGFEARDEPYASAGLGINMPIGESLQFTISARSILLSDQASDELAKPSEVKANYMYSAGLRFSLGGKRSSAGSVLGREMENIRSENRTREEALERELARTTARLDSLAQIVSQQRGIPARTAVADTIASQAVSTDATATPPSRATQRAISTPTGAATTMAKEQQFVTLPIPEEGELYIRFGRPGGVNIETFNVDPLPATPRADSTQAAGANASNRSTNTNQAAPGTTTIPAAGTPLTAEQIRQIVAETMQATAQGPQASDQQRQQDEAQRQIRRDVNNRLDAIEQRLDQRLDALQAATREAASLPTTSTTQPQPLVVQPQPVPDTVVARTDTTLGTAQTATPSPAPIRYRFAGMVPLVGFHDGEGLQQAVLTVRGDVRTNPNSMLRWTPEISLGFGESTTTFLIGLSALRPLGTLFADTLPYVGAGASFLSVDGLNDLQFALSLHAGVERPVGPGALTLEYQTLDFFDFSRILLGYRLPF